MHSVWVALLSILAFLWVVAAIRILAGISKLQQALAGVSVSVLLVVRFCTDRYFRISPLYAFTNPLGAALFFYILLRSAFLILRGGGVVWRDTFYPLDQLRRGVVWNLI
jgi:hypothetical protein